MADMNATNQNESPLSKLSERLHSQLDSFCNIDALLSCAAETLWEKNEGVESARRVICIAREILAKVRDQIDESALEASKIQGVDTCDNLKV